MSHHSYLTTRSYGSPLAHTTHRTTPNSPTYSTSSLTLSDHIQGSLLGLMLSPVALSLRPDATVTAIATATNSMAKLIYAAMNGQAPAHHWLSQLSTLIRDHDASPAARHERLTTSHQKFLSNILSRTLSEQPLTRSWLQQQITICNLHSSATQDALSQDNQFQAIVAGANSAIAHQASYCLSVSAGAASAIASAPRLNWEAALVAGLLAGALSGRSGLPVLWQRPVAWGNYRLVPAEAIAMANQLFAQWAGAIDQSNRPKQ